MQINGKWRKLNVELIVEMLKPRNKEKLQLEKIAIPKFSSSIILMLKEQQKHVLFMKMFVVFVG